MEAQSLLECEAKGREAAPPPPGRPAACPPQPWNSSPAPPAAAQQVSDTHSSFADSTDDTKRFSECPPTWDRGNRSTITETMELRKGKYDYAKILTNAAAI